jgi:hypothetical protein
MGINKTNIIIETGSSVSVVSMLRAGQSWSCGPSVIMGKEFLCSLKNPHSLWDTPGKHIRVKKSFTALNFKVCHWYYILLDDEWTQVR